MSSPKIIVILGATGNQGGSVATTFLQEPGWQVRAVTRNSSSTKAQGLAARGAQVVQADMDAPKSLEAAFDGANAIFAVSDFWGLYADASVKGESNLGQPLNVWAAKREEQQLKNVIDAAARVPTLDRFVLSSLLSVTKWSQGKYTHVYHYDFKARAEDYGKETYPQLWEKTSILQATGFLSNYMNNPGLRPVKAEDGTVQFVGAWKPDLKIPLIAAEEDTGPLTRSLIREAPGKNLIACRDSLTYDELAVAFTNATGLKAEAALVSTEKSTELYPPELREEFVDNFSFFNEFGFDGRDPTAIYPRDLESPPALETVEDYFKKQDWSKVLDL